MELEELDANIVELDEYRCRTCLFSSDKTMCFTQVNQLCYPPHKTVKDILIQMIPQMETTLSEDDRVCRTCLKTVISFARFIDKCLEIENQLTQDTDDFVRTLEKDATRHKQTDQTASMGNAQVVENIEIVVENDLEKSLDHDHIYIKTECEDSNEEYLEPIELQESTSADEREVVLTPTTEIAYEEYDAPMITEMIDEQGNLVETESGELLGAEVGEEYLEGEMVDDLQPETMLIKKETLEGETIKMYQCSKCSKLFKNSSGLNAHFKLLHLNLAPFKCHICQETFGRADYLKKHLQSHAEDKEKKGGSKTTPGKFIRFKNTDDPLPCKICGKFYNGINKLKVHLQTHVVVKRYQCEFCNLTYKRWPSLKRHEKTHLESEENFHRCNVCWKRLKTEEELKLHMASHGNPKYQCHICDEQFHRKYLFDNHYLLEHATPEDLENSKKEIIYDTLLELSHRMDP